MTEDRPPRPGGETRIVRYVDTNPDASVTEVLGALGLDPSEWADAVERALAGESPDSVGVEGQSPQLNPGDDADESGRAGGEHCTDTEPSGDAREFAAPATGVYPTDLNSREKWMAAVGKQAFAPWGDRDHPEADPDKDARWKWGLECNHATGDTVDEWREKDPRITGRAFVQQESDPFAFVDGDDVRCPDSGTVHPVFRDILDRLGATYTDISTSGSGVHATYRGDLPNDQGQAVFQIDTDPWGANDDPPTVEIYANTHLSVTTGAHVPGTPREVRAWDETAVADLLDEYDALKDPDPVGHDTDTDLSLADHNPDATGRDETTTDARDIAHAVDQLRPRDLPLRTRQVGTDSTGWEKWDPSTYRTSSGNDSLHRPPREAVFHDHKHGEAFGVLSLFAAEQGILSKPWDRLAGGDWWDAVEAAREAGAPIPEYDGRRSEDTDPVANLPLEKLDALAGPERERLARRRGLSIPDTDDVRAQLRDAVFRELGSGNRTVLDAPTALGKTHTVATEPWLRRADVTRERPVVHLHQTREARDQALRATHDSAADGKALRGRQELSPLARGDHDPREVHECDDEDRQVVTIDGDPASQWFDRMCDGKGIPFSTALALARGRNDQDLDELPPVGQEDPAVAQWNDAPRDDDGDVHYDVIHATHQFAYVPSMLAGTNVIIDEQPDYSLDDLAGDHDRIRRMVNAFLRAADAPVKTWEQFVTLAQHDAARGDAAREREALADAVEYDPAPEWFVDESDAHALAPDLTRALFRILRWEEPDANGRRSTRILHEPPRFDADRDDGFGGAWLSVVLDDENTVRTVRLTPDFRAPRAVIGLDAHPCMPLWQQNAAGDMVRDAVLDADERRLWRRYERGLTVVQVGEATRPRSGDMAREWMNDERVRAVVERLRDHYGDQFGTAIATAQVESRVEQVLAECGITDPETMHQGEEKSRNDFADEQAGYVYGCMDPGDEFILDALAELGLEAEPVTVETEDGDMVREKGRTFEGPDADTARALLASVRENHIAQSAGRYARNPDDPDSRAVVFVHTDATPPGFADYQVNGVEWLASDLQREIIDALGGRPSATVRELADAVGCSKAHVRETLDRLADEGHVTCHEQAGPHGADLYRDDDATDALVELGLNGDETANNPLQDPNRWALAIYDLHATATEPTPVVEALHDRVTTPDDSDPPPEWAG